MKSIILAVLCFLALPLIAQNALVPDPVPPQRSPRGELQSLGESKTFKENITIRLYGTTTTGNDIDLSLSGIGPSFTADQVLNDDTMLTCKYVVSETETGYKVSYSVGVSIKVPTSSTDFGYREFSISGTVLCNVDRPQVLVRYGSKPLQLTITKEAEQ